MEKEFKEIIERLIRIETILEGYESVRTKTEEARSKAYTNERRINEIEEKLKWLERTLFGALITGGVGILFIILKLGLGLS